MNGYKFDRLRILVVDDNQYMRQLVVTILQAFGTSQIFQASEAQTAWRILRDANPDVMILDWMMEGMSGLDLAKMIRTSTTSPNPFIPIIMLTGYTSIEHVSQARDAGINEFLAKPVSVNSILARLVSVIEHPRSFVRTKTYFGPCRRRRATSDYEGPERRGVEAEPVDQASQQEAAA